AMMAGMMFWYHFLPDWRLLLLPAFAALAFGAAFGAGLWLCALNVEYRDFRYIVPFIVQFGLYISPVGFSSAIVPDKWKAIYAFKRMVGVIDGFRWSLLGGEARLVLPSLISAIAITGILCATGIWYFRRTEKTFADVI